MITKQEVGRQREKERNLFSSNYHSNTRRNHNSREKEKVKTQNQKPNSSMTSKKTKLLFKSINPPTTSTPSNKLSLKTKKSNSIKLAKHLY